jgi:predicted RNase H-like nuclease (RuvC/YqgF family)
MSDLELTMMRRVGELNKENARLKEAIADSYKAVDEMEKRFKELEAEFEMHPMAVENARLKAEVERLMVFCNCTLIPNKELQAKVERLTKQNALATPRHLIASQDIKTLREQIEELKLENSQYEEHHKYGQNVITSLREEVERLTKAGDTMVEAMWYGDNERSIWVKKFAETDWNRAKEGKHS